MFCEEEGGWVSGFCLHPFASVLLFSGSHWRFLLSIFSSSSSLVSSSTSSSSLVSSSTSSEPSVVPPSTELQDSKRTIGEVATGR